MCRSQGWRLGSHTYVRTHVRTHARVWAHHTSEEHLFGGSHHVNVIRGDNNVVNMLEQVRPSTADLGSVHRRLSCRLLSGYTAPPTG